MDTLAKRQRKFTKVLAWMWVGVTATLLIVIAYGILSCYVSLKYEVEEPRMMDMANGAIEVTDRYVRELISWLWIVLAYLALNLIAVVRLALRR